jgi:hypothetical protein
MTMTQPNSESRQDKRWIMAVQNLGTPIVAEREQNVA